MPLVRLGYTATSSMRAEGTQEMVAPLRNVRGSLLPARRQGKSRVSWGMLELSC